MPSSRPPPGFPAAEAQPRHLPTIRSAAMFWRSDFWLFPRSDPAELSSKCPFVGFSPLEIRLICDQFFRANVISDLLMRCSDCDVLPTRFLFALLPLSVPVPVSLYTKLVVIPCIVECPSSTLFWVLLSDRFFFQRRICGI